ncbi:DUF1028 domain-containing protein [Candidatus Fermentibacteria bacterium]|nr:DUF1028 domain-containing protein [Candidatus Fermentibacteria bacterium]
MLTSTFSIVAVDEATGEAGVAVASRVLAVGHIVPWAEPGAGALATQALANAGFGPLGIGLLDDGFTAVEVEDSLRRSDPDIEQRQLGVVDMSGRSASLTGSETLDWAGGLSGPGYAVQGNILVGPEVVADMETAFLETEGPLARRLLSALRAGDLAGGDKRGKQSAAILVVRPGGGYQRSSDLLVDIRVDDHTDPVSELIRIYELWEPVFVLPVYLDAGTEPELEWALEMARAYVDSPPGDMSDTTRANVLNNVAWNLASRGLRPQQALHLALEATELLPQNANIMDTVAEAYYADGQVEKAVEWEQRALRLEPDNEFFGQQMEKFRAER